MLIPFQKWPLVRPSSKQAETRYHLSLLHHTRYVVTKKPRGDFFLEIQDTNNDNWRSAGRYATEAAVLRRVEDHEKKLGQIGVYG